MYINPHNKKKNQYKVQMHCHTTRSDGKWTPEQVVKEYQRLGFDVLAITDHDSLTTEPSKDPGGHSMLFIRGIEESFGVKEFPERTIHITAIGTDKYYPNPENGMLPSGQDVINEHKDAFLTIAHPTYATSNPWATIPDKDLVALHGFNAIEICNSYCVRSGQEGNAEGKWDTVLNTGKQIWGVAVDDTHKYELDPIMQGSSFCIVEADELKEKDIIKSLKAGNFYPSEGPKLSFEGEGNTFQVITDEKASITWQSSNGIIREVLHSTKDSFKIPDDIAWVRVNIRRDSDQKRAWSQPLFNK